MPADCRLGACELMTHNPYLSAKRYSPGAGWGFGRGLERTNKAIALYRLIKVEASKIDGQGNQSAKMKGEVGITPTPQNSVSHFRTHADPHGRCQGCLYRSY